MLSFAEHFISIGRLNGSSAYRQRRAPDPRWRPDPVTQADIRHHRLNAEGVELHYVTAGKGPPLVLVHGFPQTWYQWRHLIDRLADRFTVIAPDLRGLGATPGPPAPYDKQTLAGDVNAIVRRVGGDAPALVVGHDMGSFVAFAYALRYPAAVSGLMLVDAPPPGATDFNAGGSVFEASKAIPWHLGFHNARDVAEMLVAGRERAYVAQFVASRIHDAAAISEADLDVYAAAYSAPGAMRAAFEMYRALADDAVFNRAAIAQGKLAMPVVSVGAAGRLSAESLAEVNARIAVRSRVVMIDRCGHWISEEQPDVLAREILALADEVSAATPQPTRRIDG
jgi:pimeloyl-ACP methyl ester carboxylesterase